MKILDKFSIVDNNQKRRYVIKCECSCGKIFETRSDSTAKSCGCLKSKIDRTRKVRKFKFSTQERIKKAKIISAKIVYTNYSDGDISFEEFLNLSQPCNAFHQGLKKDGSVRLSKKINKNGTKCYRHSTYSDLGQEATFIYNGLDRINHQNIIPKIILLSVVGLAI